MLTDYLSSPIFITAAVWLVIAVYVFTQSVLATGATIALIGCAIYIAALIELPNVNTSMKSSSPSPLDFLLGKSSFPGMMPSDQEVFYVAGNKYTYDMASAVCAAQNAELASYDQVVDAHAKGGEWCGYGWSVGGMALFPTQEASWQKLQKEMDVKARTKCGRPGVNGGYFDPKTRFGVNCFGVKPACTDCTSPLQADKNPAMEDAIKKVRERCGEAKFSPFNRSQWSMWGA
jgi:hypothetical protein